MPRTRVAVPPLVGPIQAARRASHRTRLYAAVLGIWLGALLLPHAAAAASFRELRMPIEGGGEMLYALLVPDDGPAGTPRPLILALHPGGERTRYYGEAYARMMVAPAASELGGIGAIIVAPDCPTRSWADAQSDRAVMALLDLVMRDHKVDRKRVLVTGYSMGGRGTWFMASRHPDLFTAAIPMAASFGDESVEDVVRRVTMPTYIIHSHADEVVAFAPAERAAKTLEGLGRPVQFEALWKYTHFEMGQYVPSLKHAMRWIATRW